MKYSNTVEYNISTKLDSSGLTKLQSQIKQLEASMQKMSNKELIDDEKISAAKTQLEGLNAALTKSFNPSLGILDLSKFRLELESSGVSAKGLQSAFSMMGAEGKAVLNGLTTQIANFNGGMERTSSAVDKIFTTFSNTFRWGMVSSFFSQFMNAIHSSIDYVKELDDSLTQIMLVTDYNRDSMNEFARSANEAAKAVSMTTTGMTNASLIFAQQGYNLGQSQELATLSAKVANASQQDTATTSDQITAYMNAYGLEDNISELTQAMDNWALIANISAADVGELAQASQRAASMANAVGVSGEQLASQIATIESVTREAPEQIGNGLKTLYARFSDIAAGGEDEDGFSLGKVTSELNKIGVQVLDEMGQIRDVGDIMEDLMVIWDDLDQTSKVAASQALAGKYQVNRFMALMDNSDMYQEYKGATGANAAGTLDVMNEEYAQSIEGRSAKLQASLEGLFSTIFNTDDIYPWMDAAQGAVDLLQQFFDALGGGKVILLGITSLLTQAFSQNMARSINDMVANYNLGKTRERNISTVQDTLTAAGIDQTQGIGAYIRSTANQAKLGALNEAQYDNYMGNIQQWADTSTKLAVAEEDLIDNINAINLVYGKLTTNKNAAVLEEDGTLDTSLAAMTRQGLTNDWIAQKTKSINFSDVVDEAKTAAFTLKDLQSQFDELYATSEQLAKPIDEASAALESLAATGGYSSNRVEKIKSELNELRTSIEQGDTTFEDARVKVQKYVNEMERLSTMASEMDGKSAGQILAGGGAGAQRAKTDYDFAQIQEKAIAEKANSDQSGIDFQQNIKGVLDMVAAVQQLAFAVEAFHNIGSIWSNEDLTQGEKITQIIMNLTTVLFNATTGMKNFYDGMKGAQGLFNSIRESIIKQAEAIQQKKILEEQATQTELQNAQRRAQAEVAIAEAEKVTADTNVLKAETTLQSAKANLEEAQASLSSLNADQAKIDNIKLIAQAHLTAAQAAIAHAEAEGKAVDPRAEADMLEAQDSLAQIGIEQVALNEKITTATKAVSEAEQDVLKKEKELTKVREEANIANEKLIEKQNLLVEVTNKLSGIVGVAANVQRTMSLFDSLKTVAVDALDKIGLSVGGLATKLAGIAPILLPLMALFGTAYGMFKDIEDKKAENSQNYEEAKAQLQEVQSLTEQANNFQQQYESQKGTEQPFDGLADSAREYAQSLRDLGEEDKAHQVESAILRAELQDTGEAYQNLSNVVKETQEVLSDSTYLDMMNKAYAAISNTGESVQFLAKQEQELKDKKAELNNLAKNDPYRAELEAEIAELEEYISKNQEAFEAKDQLMSAALDYNLNQASKTNGWQLGILNTPGDEDLRSATLDWQSLNSILEESVPGFAQITDENERLALALAHTRDEAQRAAIQIQQMLNESDNLTDNQKIGITRQLEQSDLSAEQSAQVVAALNIDKESTYNNIVPELQDILKQVNEGEDLRVVLKAKLSPKEFEEAIRSQIANYEPKDEDVDKESFNDLADTFYENKEQMGAEGTPFEDYSADLFENAEALENVVEGILRYNDAIESLDKSYDDWKNALENTGELTDEHLTAVRELQDTYSDFLGLSRKVSKNFASNAENLELMQEAVEGNTEAFEDLEDAAAADIYMQITGIDDLDEAKNKIEEINNILADSGIEEIPIGQIFNLDDFEGVREAINNELAGLELSAEEASQYVQDLWHLDIPADQFTVIEDDMNTAAANAESTANHVEGVVEGTADTIIDNGSFSVSSDIDSDTAEAEDTIAFTNLLPVPTGPRTITSQMPVGDGNTGTGTGVKMETFSASVYGVGYEPHTQTTTQFKQQTGFKEDVNVEKGAGKGHIGLPKGATASRAPSGGAGRSGASRPSSGGGGGGGKGRSCFIAGTLVSVYNNEYQYIEDIRRGDIVLSYNEKTRRNEYSQVLQTMTHEINEEVYLICTEETELNVTGNHKFFVKRNNKVEWVEAADLQINDLMFFADYSWHEIWHIEANIKTTTVYNFEVSHNHNYYVGIDQILAHNKGGKGGKGGGGGGSAKTIKPKEKKEHEKDYYEEVDNQLKKTEKTLSKIEKENDRLTGDKARANQNKQLTLLEKELKLQEKKLKILTEQEKVDVAASLQKADKELEEFAKTLGIDWKMPDPVYDEDGIISNYEEMSAAINDLHNRLIEQYNAAAAAGNEELTKQIEEQLSKIDKKGEDLLKKAKRMNAIQTEIEDITATIEDLKDSIEDIRIEAYKASQEALDDLVELKEQEAEIDALFHDANPNSYIDRWSIDGTPFVELKQVMQEINSITSIGMDQATAYYDNLIAERKKALETASEDEKAAIQSTIDFYTEQKSTLSEDNLENGILGIRRRDLEQLRKWMDNPSDPSNPFGDNIAALQEAYKTLYEATLKQAEGERERVQKARDKYIEVADDIQDGIERHIDGYDRLLDKLERINDTYQLYYGEDSYDGILDIMDQQANTMSSELDQLTNAYNYWTSQYQMALANGDEKLIHEIEDKMNDAEDAMLDKAAELAEHFVEMYETSVNAAIQKMTNSLWGGGPGQMDLEDQSTMWELQKDYMQNYKDDVEKAFEIDKLRSKYIDLLNDAQGMSLQTQNKIRAQMQEQLDLLENQATMSDYDVKLANAKLEILQKQIALEDAQRNKNKMQLRRDTQGNYRYVYSADQGDIKKAQDELNESRYDAYEMTKDQTIANNDRAISLYNDYMEKIAAISKKYQDDEAAREAALAALSEEYKGLFEALREDYADTTNGMYDVLTWMIDNVTNNTTNAAINMLNTLYDETGKVKENTGIAWQDLATQISTDVLPNINTAVVKTLNSINSNAQWLAQSMTGPGGALTKIGSSASELTNTLDLAKIATQNLTSATNELFGYLAADNSELENATKRMAQYEEQMRNTLSTTNKLAGELKAANAEIQAKTEEARNYKTKYEYATGQKELRKDSVVKVKQGTFVYYDRRGQDQYDDTGSYGWYLPQDMWVKLGTPNPDAPKAYNFYATGASLSAFGDRQESSGSDSRAGEAPADERHHQWWHLDEATLKRSIIDGLDTGGYTGEWNESTPFYKNGKVAMLHQKELVLNATDTQNILAAVEMIRSISGNNMANLLGKTGTSGLGFNISADYNPTTEQRVEIQATFPNATDADDIRTALLGLSDKAFQYAHRTI